jgi:hypothetical protein
VTDHQNVWLGSWAAVRGVHGASSSPPIVAEWLRCNTRSGCAISGSLDRAPAKDRDRPSTDLRGCASGWSGRPGSRHSDLSVKPPIGTRVQPRDLPSPSSAATPLPSIGRPFNPCGSATPVGVRQMWKAPVSSFSPFFGCQRVGGDRISLRRDSMRRKIDPQQTRNPRNVGLTRASARVWCAFPSPWHHSGGHVLCHAVNRHPSRRTQNGRKS